MKKIRTLLVQFENELPAHKITAFRGAVVEKVGREHILYHQHKSDTEVLYTYPLIQYKIIHNKPCIICLGEGVDEIHKLFNHASWDINLLGDRMVLVIDRLDLNNQVLNIWDKKISYTIRNWMGLNADNYKKYLDLTEQSEMIDFLENILKANILSFAKGLKWEVEKPILLTITGIVSQQARKFKGISLITFDLDFQCNVSLPNYIGLGKSVSQGYGMVRSINNLNDSK